MFLIYLLGGRFCCQEVEASGGNSSFLGPTFGFSCESRMGAVLFKREMGVPECGTGEMAWAERMP